MIGAGELLPLCLASFDDGQGHEILGKGLVDREHLQRFLFGFFIGRMRGVTFLPEELGGAQKKTRSHFPAHHIGPLVDEKRQVAIRLNPITVRVPDNRFRRRPDISGSSSFCPPACVTTATSGANPSTCSASFWRKLSGMNIGK